MSDERSETAGPGEAAGMGTDGASPAGERSGAVVDLRPAPAHNAVAVPAEPRREPEPPAGAAPESGAGADAVAPPGAPIDAPIEPSEDSVRLAEVLVFASASPVEADPAAVAESPTGTAPQPGPDAAPGSPIGATDPGEDALRLAEALVFASATPVSARVLSQLLPDTADAEAVIAALRARYAGRGVELADVGNGVQFRTAPDLAPRLRKVIEIPRRLPRVAMETLAIIAYHQPVTRAEVEDIRGTSLSQQTLDALLEAGLVAPKGRKETPGRPTLWGTTPQFLAQFGLKDMRELPRREDLVLEPPQPAPDLVPEAREAVAEDQTVTSDH